MKYYELFKEENDNIMERYELSMERIESILDENSVDMPFLDFFHRTARFILQIKDLVKMVQQDELKQKTLDELKTLNHALYEEILGPNYDKSYANPTYAVKMLGEDYATYLSFLYAEIRGMIVYAFESRLTDITIHNELFIEIYNLFEQVQDLSVEKVKSVLYWFVSDYSDMTVEYRIREQLDTDLSFATDIILNSDLNDIRYLYQFGEFVTENEIKTAMHLNSMSEEQIDAMARTYTQGYRMGFILGNKDLSKKEIVNIRYHLGFERIVKRAIEQFKEMGLRPAIHRSAVNSINKKQHHRLGYYGAIPNKQFDYDHKADNAIYLDKAFVERKLGVLKVSYEKYKKEASKFAGPAVMEIFGEHPFAPISKKECFRLSDKQQKLSVEYDRESGQITNQYIKGEERSFTIIAYPIPDIGENYEEIFDEIVKINTLDYKLYEGIQQIIIDALDRGTHVVIKGRNGNRTNLTVQLNTLKDKNKETNFENCVADVNIPVGEVFTSPKLTGTNGILHVSQVYLNELKYVDLEIEFEDGKIKDYRCKNFETEAENKKFIKENLLYNHETLPMGEFAIGTNTTAYMVAKKYDIADKLPILIAEKMGPHFAVGDTCYSWSEDNVIYNPNKKEIVAKDNEISILRKEDISKAYFNCHTDITLPYEELGEIAVVTENGDMITIIKDSRFVLEGTQELNKPFDVIE
ncbi:aminopeptidase [Candidatus Galacturonibacter soehngenii]|uniref:Leucyl aminopeptidase n=1 Tax=Candidatus Galacturonatibacter soehngenii TaxID=2307010 RepID=A0A7V7QPX1_9FIRM|nr:aminopeptidase [Candidatus Galacturonibacter soehngenii]KAB1441013.1 leucyl aminopeptidase [Candidatus Galacturonibacter soehngenii]